MELKKTDNQIVGKDCLEEELSRMRARRQFITLELENEHALQKQIEARKKLSVVQLRLYLFLLVPLTLISICILSKTIPGFLSGKMHVFKLAFVGLPITILIVVFLLPAVIFGWIKTIKLSRLLAKGGKQNLYEKEHEISWNKCNALQQETELLEEEIEKKEKELLKVDESTKP